MRLQKQIFQSNVFCELSPMDVLYAIPLYPGNYSFNFTSTKIEKKKKIDSQTYRHKTERFKTKMIININLMFV